MTALASKAAGVLHEKLVFNRRVKVLAHWLVQLVPPWSSLLDVGCGDGLVSAILQSKRPDVNVRGLDVLPRSKTHIPVQVFDGVRIPYADGAFDGVLLSDVLHHTNDPAVLLREARRVASQFVLIKDHNREGIAAGVRLRFMDWVGNSRFGVSLPYNYWTERQWSDAWREIGLISAAKVDRLGLYPIPINWFLGAKLHFIARLEKCEHSH
ncbi:MAG: class I SAM-dependent methyltransferase [Candidatus Sulfotelmatobacter sp.]